MSTATVNGWYLYGIVPSAARLPASLLGVGAAAPHTVTHGAIAAVVSRVDQPRALGSRRDLLAHARILDELAGSTSVLPARFGTVFDEPEAIVSHLLEPRRESFSDALARLAGLVQFTVSVRHVSAVVLREILDAEPEIARLRDLVRAGAGRPEVRVRLGELVAGAVARTRAEDARHLHAVLEPYREAAVDRPVTGGEPAVTAAFLVQRHGRARFEMAVAQLAAEWAGRTRVRLLGPLAPYDFAGAVLEGAQ
ncbi:GvpL/GvpF family gas vesicle protein [Actinoplanes sp. NPDC049548]|uniref:GvpL/GvpF family gas vesicle protein n=1 Tax=Actinoplanes sp. NPDC049548 TaxID=3155152 RepID=UPI00342A0D77